MHANHEISIYVVLLCYVVPLVASQCSTNPVIFNFGDSSSDTGGYVAAHGSNIASYPFGRVFFHQPTGRFSDGRLLIDFLCESVNASYLTPYLDSLGPNFTNGVNFAIFGAATHPVGGLFNLDVQVLQFGHFKNRTLKLKLEGRTNLIEEEDFSNALYTIDIGTNDLSYSFETLPYIEAVDKIPSFLSVIRKAIWDLYLLGGMKFWLHNISPLGCLPRELAMRDSVQVNDYDKYGCIKSLNDGVRVFNEKLDELCQELRSQMENSIIVYVDVYSIKYDLVANSTLYGFRSPLMACYGNGGPPYNYDPNGCLNGCTTCDERTPYISWDGAHYTDTANAITVSKILTSQYSTPPIDFNFFCSDAPVSYV